MFNRGAFNRFLLNRPASFDIFASLAFEGEGDGVISIMRDLSFIMPSWEGEGDGTIAYMREIAGRMLAWSGDGDLAVRMIRELLNEGVAWSGEGGFAVNGGKYRIESLTIAGPIAPGDKLIIDSSDLIATKNGANALHQLSGDFPTFAPGTNRLIITDPASSRTLQLRIEYREKFV